VAPGPYTPIAPTPASSTFSVASSSEDDTPPLALPTLGSHVNASTTSLPERAATRHDSTTECPPHAGEPAGVPVWDTSRVGHLAPHSEEGMDASAAVDPAPQEVEGAVDDIEVYSPQSPSWNTYCHIQVLDVLTCRVQVLWLQLQVSVAWR
jgi:hypothetical protein